MTPRRLAKPIALRWLNIADSARLMNTSEQNIRVLAHRNGWRKARRNGRIHYAVPDMLNTPRPGDA